MQTLYKAYVTSPEETAKHATDLSAYLKQGDLVLLEGPLGVGKTTFAQGVVRSFVGDSFLTVASPTFNLVATYQGPSGILWHGDLYRLEKEDLRLDELGLEEAFHQAVVLLEWPDRLKEVWLDQLDPLWIELSWEEAERGRLLTCKGSLRWQDRLHHIIKRGWSR